MDDEKDTNPLDVEPIPATEFRAGDVVHYNPRCSWRIDDVVMDGKRVRATGIYTQWDWPDEDRVGKPITHWFRAATYRPVTRPAQEPSRLA